MSMSPASPCCVFALCDVVDWGVSRLDVRHVSDRSGLRRVLKTRDSELAEGNRKVEKASHKERSLKTLVVSIVYVTRKERSDNDE
jgi:recombinational DNA repair ATPase RecF